MMFFKLEEQFSKFLEQGNQ